MSTRVYEFRPAAVHAVMLRRACTYVAGNDKIKNAAMSQATSQCVINRKRHKNTQEV